MAKTLTTLSDFMSGKFLNVIPAEAGIHIGNSISWIPAPGSSPGQASPE
jgi:hypothetical protein